MEKRKNDEVEMQIVDMTDNGEGIGKKGGMVFFVKDAVIGDRVRAKVTRQKKSYAYARLQEIVKPSPARTAPRCPVARSCGGCQLQHMRYEEQLKYKEKKVRDCLERIGGVRFQEEGGAILEPILGMSDPFHYRNKAQFPVGRGKDGKIAIGFYAERTHDIIPMEGCCIQAEGTEEIVRLVREYMEENGVEPYDEGSHSGLVRHILTRTGFATGEVMACLVINGDGIPKEERLVERLAKVRGMRSICLNVNRERTNVILGKTGRTIWGEDHITDEIDGISFRISPQSFYQVNPEQTRRMYDTVLRYAGLTGQEEAWDLYCGIGTISLFLARHAAMVHGVEISPEAVRDARRNMEANGIGNVEFIEGAAEEVLPRKCEEGGAGARARVIVVDPPRKGCDARLLEAMAQMGPDRIVYVSCEPATLARDVRALADLGYRARRVRPLDMFGQSCHVEAVCALSRVK